MLNFKNVMGLFCNAHGNFCYLKEQIDKLSDSIITKIVLSD